MQREKQKTKHYKCLYHLWNTERVWCLILPYFTERICTLTLGWLQCTLYWLIFRFPVWVYSKTLAKSPTYKLQGDPASLVMHWVFGSYSHQILYITQPIPLLIYSCSSSDLIFMVLLLIKSNFIWHCTLFYGFYILNCFYYYQLWVFFFLFYYHRYHLFYLSKIFLLTFSGHYYLIVFYCLNVSCF